MRLLVLELWGVGDVALALPFLRIASQRADVTLLAKRHAAAVLEDGALHRLGSGHLARVLAPKAAGALHLLALAGVRYTPW